jgi:hypothetical protein
VTPNEEGVTVKCERCGRTREAVHLFAYGDGPITIAYLRCPCTDTLPPNDGSVA